MRLYSAEESDDNGNDEKARLTYPGGCLYLQRSLYLADCFGRIKQHFRFIYSHQYNKYLIL